MDIKLHNLDRGIRNFLSLYLLVILIGIIVGLLYLKFSTSLAAEGTITSLNGNEERAVAEMDVEFKFPKSVAELLVTTHNHIFGFAFMILGVGIIFFFNSTVTGKWKMFLMLEPLISTILTFGSIWLVRFVDSSFVLVTIISAILLYASLIIMIAVSIYDLKFKSVAG
ncbi:MAG: hypothetical protein KKD86_18045 [Bacteroidetes bacterium]|nr:hypothetical protein [Bacteroidota bacterium]